MKCIKTSGSTQIQPKLLSISSKSHFFHFAQHRANVLQYRVLLSGEVEIVQLPLCYQVRLMTILEHNTILYLFRTSSFRARKYLLVPFIAQIFVDEHMFLSVDTICNSQSSEVRSHLVLANIIPISPSTIPWSRVSPSLQKRSEKL